VGRLAAQADAGLWRIVDRAISGLRPVVARRGGRSQTESRIPATRSCPRGRCPCSALAWGPAGRASGERQVHGSEAALV
jgi:hypothetical protein